MNRQIYTSPLGTLLLTSDGQSLTGLAFVQQTDTVGAGEGDAVLGCAARWLDAYFAGRPAGPLPPMRLEGTPFQRRVWDMLLRIPYGQTVTYGELARALRQELARPTSARAVGGAVGKNPIAILVPCHRVVGAGGRLTGYAWGLDKKQALLDMESLHRG